MLPDPTIARIREARHRISEKCGHDPRKLVEYYLALQEEQYADRLVKTVEAQAGDRREGLTATLPNLSGEGMKEQIEQYVKNVKERFDSCRDNEAATKAALAVPLLAVLGYDMADPNECKPEYKVDFGERRSVKPVDWAFCVDGSLAFLVEAKAVRKSIGNYDEQLGDYFAKGQPSVKLGILTTGVQWRFFTDLDCEHIMDKEPFLKWDILKDDVDPLRVIGHPAAEPSSSRNSSRLSPGRIAAKVFSSAELARLLEPSPDFVKLAIQNFEDRNLTAAVLAEWKPILCSAIHEWAKQQMVTMALDRAGDRQAGGFAAGDRAETSRVPAKQNVSDCKRSSC